MATEHDYQAFLDRVAALEETVADRLSSRLVTDPQLADVPLVIMSSIPEATVAERSSGYAAFVRKPFNIFAVVDLVAKLTKTKG